MIKRFVALILLFALAFGLSGCEEAPQIYESSSNLSSFQSQSMNSQSSSSQSEPEFYPEEHAVAICTFSIDLPVYQVLQLGFVEKATELGYRNVFVSGPSQGSTYDLIGKWTNDIESNGVDGAVVWTGVCDNFDQFIVDLHKKGIHIVVPFYPHSYEDTHDFIDANPIRDEYAIGAAAADFLVEKLEEKGITEGDLGVSTVISGVSSLRHVTGFQDRITELGCDFTVLDMVGDFPETQGATQKIEQYITENPNIVGAFGGSNLSAQSWSAAKENLNRQDIVVVAMAFTSPNLDILQTGGVDALIAEPLYESGSVSAEMLDQVLRGKEFTREDWNQIIGFSMVTADGAGKNGTQYYYDLFDQAEAVDWDNYMA